MLAADEGNLAAAVNLLDAIKQSIPLVGPEKHLNLSNEVCLQPALPHLIPGAVRASAAAGLGPDIGPTNEPKHQLHGGHDLGFLAAAAARSEDPDPVYRQGVPDGLVDEPAVVHQDLCRIRSVWPRASGRGAEAAAAGRQVAAVARGRRADGSHRSDGPECPGGRGQGPAAAAPVPDQAHGRGAAAAGSLAAAGPAGGLQVPASSGSPTSAKQRLGSMGLDCPLDAPGWAVPPPPAAAARGARAPAGPSSSAACPPALPAIGAEAVAHADAPSRPPRLELQHDPPGFHSPPCHLGGPLGSPCPGVPCAATARHVHPSGPGW